jgi:prophage antirepressor-like protein
MQTGVGMKKGEEKETKITKRVKKTRKKTGTLYKGKSVINQSTIQNTRIHQQSTKTLQPLINLGGFLVLEMYSETTPNS